MKHFSKKYLQEFIEGELPADSLISSNLSKKAFEIEGIEKHADGDSLYEVKVLPNRIASALNVYGMAGEVAAVSDLEVRDVNEVFKLSGTVDVITDASIEKRNEYINLQTEMVKRMTVMAVSISGMKETPVYIKELLEKSGSRSINNLVDMTNYVLITLGQPTHVFDADKVMGKLSVRYAAQGEQLELLDGKVINLNEKDIVIADDVRALSLAGVKGGKPAEIDQNTKRVIFEIGVFDADTIRKTTQHHGIRTDASKIYENNLATCKAATALRIFKKLLTDDYGDDFKIDFVADEIQKEDISLPVKLNLKDVNKFAGKNIEVSKIINILENLNYKIIKQDDDEVEVLAQADRLDVTQSADVIDDVLRIYGLDNIESTEPILNKKYTYDTYFLVENKIRKMLIEKGYSDIFTYTFKSAGEVKVLKAVAEDKNFLRSDLSSSTIEVYEKNKNYAAIYEEDMLRFFEIGSVFTVVGESRRCVLVADDSKKKSKYLPELEDTLKEILNIFEIKDETINDFIINKNEKPASLEFDIDKIIEHIRKEKINLALDIVWTDISNINYKNYSLYPFIVRDVSIWCPSETQFENIKTDVENLKLNYFLKVYKFDEFTPTDETNINFGKTSIAFRIIYQSSDKTLTDVEVESEMQKVNEYLKEKDFEVR